MAKKSLSIILEDGSIDNVELLFAFEFNDTKREYAVYTRNETDDNGNITIYVSSVIREGENVKLGGISTDEEWTRIKDVLRELSKKQ
ncbi:MAG: DUF1292 domain-containing protein [bacterium]|nr:DUF1292 domain-containing protein [bacterium]